MSVAADDRDAAVKPFMRNSIGIPAPFVLMMRMMPIWRDLRAVAPTPFPMTGWRPRLPAGCAGAPIDADEWTSVKMPTLVVAGEKSPEVFELFAGARRGAPGERQVPRVAGVSHSLKMKALAPVLGEFLGTAGQLRRVRGTDAASRVAPAR